MKKILFLSILLFTAGVVAQQNNFDEQWRKIDSLEVLGQVETADKLVDELVRKAWSKKKYPDLLKGLIYHYRLYQVNHEDSNQYILDDLLKRIDQIPAPYKNVLLSYKATFLEQYYNDNRWSIRNRTDIDDPDPRDIETWPLGNLQDSIRRTYERSLQGEQRLINTPAENITLLISPNSLNRKYKPTLYDLLAHRALEYFSDSGNFPSIRPEERFSFNQEVLYAPTPMYIKLWFPAAAGNTSEVKVLQIYQKLEALHFDKKDTEAQVFAQLERLEYVNNNFRGNGNWEKYDTALTKLSEQYHKKPVRALILFTKAYSLYERSTETDEDGKLLHPQFLKQALSLAENITQDYPHSDSAQKAFGLMSSIKAVVLEAKIPAILPSDTPGRIFLYYKSIDTLQLRISCLTEQQAQHGFDYTRDSVITRMAQSGPIHTATVALPQAADYNRHSTEIPIPPLEKGSYLVYVSGTDDAEESGFSYAILQVSDIALSRTDFDLHALYRATDRTTGEALEHVKIEFFNRNEEIIQRDFTDEKGEIKDRLDNSRSRSNRVRVINKGDTLNTHYWHRYSYYETEEEEIPAAKTLLYLDRAIYRPGQKVYFKGVLLEHEKKKTRTVPNEFVEITVDDPNGETVAEFRLKTNKYGSFNGEFRLPDGGITGEFSIFAEEDTESETAFWNKIWENGDFHDSGVSFSVEEYKRPTFEVAFDSINESFKLQDTVTLTGKVNSFMGAALGDVKVSYEINRQKLRTYWWYHDYEEAVFLETDSVQTDAAGNFSIRFKAAAEGGDLKEDDLIYRYVINATVTDITGETREARTNLKLGNKNLLVNLEMPESVQSGDTLKAKVQATNLNGIAVPAKGLFRIYKLQGPDRILKNRIWEAPEINVISEKEFRQLFPEEPYTSQLPPEEWPQGEMIYESRFDTDGKFEPEIPITSAFQSGKYLVEIVAASKDNEALSKKTFDLFNPEDRYLPDNQRFAVSIQNKEFRKDGQINLLIQTGYSDLRLQVAAYDNQKTIFSKSVAVDGKQVVAIPVKDLAAEEIQIQVNGVRNNAVINDSRVIHMPRQAIFLQLETETFRNKILPGLEETWSFRIRDEKDEIPDAEILASMYDASLDQFKTQSWNTDPAFSHSWPNFPEFNHTNVGGVEAFTNKFPRVHAYRSLSRTFDRLQLFGFYLGRSNSYQYQNYLNNRREQKESTPLTGNTRGKVTDAGGMPLPGVTVVISGTSTGTTTNFDGEFALDTKAGDVLVFSYLGYMTTEIGVGKEKEVYAVMEEDSASLEEVVVMGYVAMEAKASQQRDQADAARALQGKVAGISVVEENRAAAPAPVIKIRGASSISGENRPLYIVDGKPVTDYEVKAEDILELKMLQGSEATALYGAGAANGVVIITTTKGLEELQNVEARKNLDETAFFYPNLQLGADGKLQFSFTTPEALTQWKLRLLAHTKDWTTGKYEGRVITQKNLSIIPNAPRFLREGDTIIFKAKISNLSDRTLSGSAILQLFDAITMEPIDSLLGNSQNLQPFNLSNSNSAAVSWNLSIPKGVQAVTYRLLARAGEVSDGEENLLPVLSNSMLVTESLPFFVRAGETENYEFKNLKENTSSTLKHHRFSLEYSSNPAWYAVQSLPYLMEFEHECSEQTFARLYANSLSAHILNSRPAIKTAFETWKKDSVLLSDLEKNEELKSLIMAETPWLREATSETAQKHRLAQLFDLQRLAEEQEENLKRLSGMQNTSGAFPWFSGGRDNYFITRHIVAGLGHLQRLGVNLETDAIAQKAIHYLDNELLEQKRKALQHDGDLESFYKNISNLHYLYARSFFLEKFPLSDSLNDLSTDILHAQQENWLVRDVYNKGLLSLVLSRFDQREAAGKILKALKESAVKSEEHGMYWKENTPGWYWYRAPVETQALLIEAFSEYGNDAETVEELKIWLLQNKRSNHWPTTKATTEATYALLMQGDDWLQTADSTILKLGGQPIPAEKLAGTKTEAGTGYRKISWKAEEVDESFSRISVENNDSTAGYGGAYWQYFEDLDKIKSHTESPLNIEKELYVNAMGSSGNELRQISPQTQLKTGDLVTVRLVVRTTADMDYVHLKDMRASGFEPTNVLSEYKYRDGTAYYESTRDAATHFFFDNLRKGTYVLEYTVRANNAGNFSNGITTIESMYAPEFSGHTKGMRVNIKE